MPNVFKIPEALHGKYHGAGVALAAVTGEQIVNLVYLRDALPDFDEFDHDLGINEDTDHLKAAIADPRLGPTVRELQSLGAVHVGMCSCYEFVEL